MFRLAFNPPARLNDSATMPTKASRGPMFAGPFPFEASRSSSAAMVVTRLESQTHRKAANATKTGTSRIGGPEGAARFSVR